MNIFLEGPWWAGMWSEIVQDSLRHIGHRVFLYYHNKKPLSYRLLSGASHTVFRQDPRERKANFSSYSNSKVVRLIKENDFDAIFSIQGKIDKTCIRTIRKYKPKIKIIYWIGDVLSIDGGQEKVEKIHDIVTDVDCIMLSYRGDFERMRKEYGEKIIYFPFGTSRKYHLVKSITGTERTRYTSDISFVGTYYPERGDSLKYLMSKTSSEVRIWGRGWRNSNGLRSRGRLSLESAQKVHSLSKISLNIHHRATRNGFNMKFFEIPACGGFELCDWQDEIGYLGLSDLVATYKTMDEMRDKMDYFIRKPSERTAMSEKFRNYVITNCSYDKKFSEVLRNR